MQYLDSKEEYKNSKCLILVPEPVWDDLSEEQVEEICNFSAARFKVVVYCHNDPTGRNKVSKDDVTVEQISKRSDFTTHKPGKIDNMKLLRAYGPSTVHSDYEDVLPE
jgi:hypothetical protein